VEVIIHFTISEPQITPSNTRQRTYHQHSNSDEETEERRQGTDRSFTWFEILFEMEIDLSPLVFEVRISFHTPAPSSHSCGAVSGEVWCGRKALLRDERGELWRRA
jgi:hypothetical protein